jgi:hypothetical protein
MRFRWLHEHYHWQRRQPKDLPRLRDLAAVVFRPLAGLPGNCLQNEVPSEGTGGTKMSENVFVGADSFRRLLLGAAGGYELQGHHEAAETVLHVIDALDELTTGGKGRSQADEDQEAMAAAETVRLYCEKRRKTGCCGESCIFDKGNKGALCPLYGSPMGWDRFGGKENG